MERQNPEQKAARAEIARNYDIDPVEVDRIIAEWHSTGTFQSPYTRCNMSYLLDALATMGINAAHKASDVQVVMQRMMEKSIRPRWSREGIIELSDWDRFVSKPGGRERKRGRYAPRSPNAVALLAYNRIVHAACSLRKNGDRGEKHAPGLKLARLGCCVDVFRIDGPDGGALFYLRLNQHSTTPLKLRLGSAALIPPVDTRLPTRGPSQKRLVAAR